MSAADALAASVSTMAILAALYHKKSTGKGQHINISMQDVMGWITAESWPLYFSGTVPHRIGNRHLVLAPQNIYKTKDGLVAIAVENQDNWEKLANLIGFTWQKRSFSYHKIKQIEQKVENEISSWASDKTQEYVVTTCQQLRIPAAPVLEIGDIVDHPHTWDRGMIVELEQSGFGKIRLLGSPFKLSLTPSVMENLAPSIGEHSRQILGDLLGYTDKEIESLKEEGIIVLKPEE
jgi:crotonobetainyl-CoA:carnitine CoA-transferase CaiB-like acyl-CoA transferase